MENASAKTRQILCLTINLVIVVMEVYSTILSVSGKGFQTFRFYTQDSNALALLTSLLLSVYIIRSLLARGSRIPMWVRLLKYMSTCCLAVTLLVVIFVLIPTMPQYAPEQLLFIGSSLYQHTLCPILAILCFVFLEHEPKLEVKHALVALIPTILYAVISAVLNILRVMEGPYPFLYVYKQPVYMSVFWFVAIVGGAYLIALALRALNLKLAPGRK